MSRMGAPDAYYALCDERGPDGPEGEVGESKSLEELLNPRGKRALFQMEPAQEMARRLRKLAEWADPARHGHGTEQAAAEVRQILEGKR